jgi:hypothetical protein
MSDFHVFKLNKAAGTRKVRDKRVKSLAVSFAPILSSIQNHKVSKVKEMKSTEFKPQYHGEGGGEE